MTIIVVAHGVVIRVALTSLVAGFVPSDFDRIAIDFASVHDLGFDGESWTGAVLIPVVADPRPDRGDRRRRGSVTATRSETNPAEVPFTRIADLEKMFRSTISTAS